MDARVPYTLPIRGLQDGTHTFDYEVDGAFFATFADSPVQNAAVAMEVKLDKRPNLLVFDFDLLCGRAALVIGFNFCHGFLESRQRRYQLAGKESCDDESCKIHFG